jgi:hypothetical protein
MTAHVKKKIMSKVRARLGQISGRFRQSPVFRPRKKVQYQGTVPAREAHRACLMMHVCRASSSSRFSWLRGLISGNVRGNEIYILTRALVQIYEERRMLINVRVESPLCGE